MRIKQPAIDTVTMWTKDATRDTIEVELQNEHNWTDEWDARVRHWHGGAVHYAVRVRGHAVTYFNRSACEVPCRVHMWSEQKHVLFFALRCELQLAQTYSSLSFLNHAFSDRPNTELLWIYLYLSVSRALLIHLSDSLSIWVAITHLSLWMLHTYIHTHVCPCIDINNHAYIYISVHSYI